jgi:hypothetical protein
MFKTLWDKLVEKAIEAIIWGILGSTALALWASAALLQWTNTPWFWRRAVMATVLFLSYTAILKFAPRWAIPHVSDNKHELYLNADGFEDENLRIRIQNPGPTDEFVAEVWLVAGGAGFVNEHIPVRWHNHAGDNRQITKGGTQYLHLLRAPRVVVNDNEATLQVFLLSPNNNETQLHPHWTLNNHIAPPIELHLYIRSASTGASTGALVTVNLAKAGTGVNRSVVLSRR